MHPVKSETCFFKFYVWLSFLFYLAYLLEFTLLLTVEIFRFLVKFSIFTFRFLFSFVLLSFWRVLKVNILNGGFINHTLSIAITQAAFKLYAKWPKAVKRHQNSVKIILVALELKNYTGALQENRFLPEWSFFSPIFWGFRWGNVK